ncbi:MAG: flavodoxin domain-containing protein [Prolixibacteraceae bacterium]|nr:flavodoxin domain-containing protein [Prolixibacteraceae bacterium]
MRTKVNTTPETPVIRNKPLPVQTLHILFGSRTGNSESAARLAWEYAKHLGIKTELLDMKSVHPAKVRQFKNLLIAVSTHGEGDPPAVVENFYNYVHSREMPLMKGVKFSVLALGDSSYKDYCKTGHDFRKQLLKLGAKEISPLVECDIDYEENARKWVYNAVSAFQKILHPEKLNGKKEFVFKMNKRTSKHSNVHYAEILEKKLLTPEKSEKAVYHFSLSVKNLNTPFHPGDSFGIYASNSRPLVDKLLQALGWKGAMPVQINGKTRLLKEVLLNDVEITLVTPLVVKKYAELSGNKALQKLTGNKTELEQFCQGHDITDMVTLFPGELGPEAFLSTLRKLSPRLYSVASSPLVSPGELHLTAGIIDYTLNQRQHRGVCSVFLNDRTKVGDSIPLFYEPNTRFRLPEDGRIPVIMIATGTGIAPFRAFLQERQHCRAKGKNWLFFGDRHAASHFLYGDEIQQFHRSGVLTKMNLAFSRDQKEKKYVQHLLLENSREIFEWIDQGNAVVYLCGNKRTIGKEAKAAFKTIISKEGDFTPAETENYWQQMKSKGRFLADVY